MWGPIVQAAGWLAGSKAGRIVAAVAGAIMASGGRFYIHSGAPALPAATLTSDDLRGDVTIVGSRPRRDLFNGVRAVYVEPAAAWQPTDAPPLLASNYVTEDGGQRRRGLSVRSSGC